MVFRLTDGVAYGPGDEVHGDGEGLLGLAGDVSGGVVLVRWSKVENNDSAYLDKRLMPRPWAAQKESTM